MYYIVDSLYDFIKKKNINIASFVRQLKLENPTNKYANKLTQQKLYLSFQHKRTLTLEEFVLIVGKLKKEYPEISSDMFINLNQIIH